MAYRALDGGLEKRGSPLWSKKEKQTNQKRKICLTTEPVHPARIFLFCFTAAVVFLAALQLIIIHFSSPPPPHVTTNDSRKWFNLMLTSDYFFVVVVAIYVIGIEAE